MPTRETLISIAQDVRDAEVSDPHGQCFPASKSLEKELIQETVATKDEVEVEEVVIGSAARRHYVVAYPASKVDDVDTYGRVLIDITLDQYCTEFEENGKVQVSIGPRENIPEVNFFQNKEIAPFR